MEESYRLTRGALELIARHRFPLHLLTKSDLILRDTDVLQEIARVRAVVSFTITTVDDDLAAIVEPDAPSPSRRLGALEALSASGIETGVMLMPVLPFLEDTEDNVRDVLTRAHECGARHVVAAMGMTLRDRQRAYYYARLDEHFPGLREAYERAFGGRYSCPAGQAGRLEALHHSFCEEHGLSVGVAPYEEQTTQLTLF